MEDPEVGETLTAEEPAGFTQVPDSLLLNPDISDGAYRLYALLKSHVRPASAVFPGRPRLARLMGVKSVRTIDSRIAELKAAGYLKVTPRFRKAGGQSTNHYHLLFYPRPPHAPESAAAEQGGGVQNFAGRNELHPGGADGCSGPVQPAAGERSRSFPSTSSLTTPPSGQPAVDRSAGRSGAGVAGQEEARGDRGWAAAQAQQPSWSQPGHGAEVGWRDPADLGSGAARGAARGAADAGQAVPAATAGESPVTAPDRYRGWATAVVEALPAQLYPKTRSQFEQMVTLVQAYGEHSGTEPQLLAQQLVTARSLPEVVTHPVGLLKARLSQLAPARPQRPAAPAWCGECDERTRQRWEESTDTVSRCPVCHPMTVEARG